MFRSTIISTVLATTYFGTAAAFIGDATLFRPAIGACGAVSVDSDSVVALSPSQYANGTHCLQHILVHANGRTVDAIVVDLCPDCGSGSIALSPSAFFKLAPIDTGTGIIHVTWEFE
ncbi:hypothetical protein QCA50_011331 [Cerrena zonata]|uniref:RlpA-like protein double-psi beta-barrel domain-containing protein n=1 Tax=Cerrena zonata TaxID=2478898 RepID=A0AAW0G6Z7_9APHY